MKRIEEITGLEFSKQSVADMLRFAIAIDKYIYGTWQKEITT